MTMLKAELQEAYDALVEERDALLEGQAEFIEGIIDVAGRAAYHEELCHVLEKTFGKIGIDPPSYTVKIERTVTEEFALNGFDYYRLGLFKADSGDFDALTRFREGLDGEWEYVEPVAVQTVESEPTLTIERAA